MVAWLSIRQQRGHLILRIEDIDSPRIKSWATQQAIDDLKWLGLDWDEGPDRPKDQQKYIQSERTPSYELALRQLKDAEAVYPCVCTRSDVQEAASAPHEISDGPIYGRTCFHQQVEHSKSLESNFAWRFRTNENLISFDDGLRGHLQSNVQQELGDFVVYKNDDSPAYQLSVVVDDHEMGVTEVVRGSDLVPSTFRQLCLYRFFEWPIPRFIHVPLVVGSDGKRLAKRHGDTRLSHYRDAGISPERIIGLLAYSLGWTTQLDEISANELLDIADLKAIPSEPFVVGLEQIQWLESGIR